MQVGDYFVALPEAAALAAIARAYVSGIRYFDTAPRYGKGLSEHRIGQILRGHPRADFVLSTKVGRNLIPERDEALAGDPARRGLPFRFAPDLSYDGTLRGVEQSLHRLGFSRIDLVFIHALEPREYGEDYDARFGEAMDGCYRALDDLRRQKTIGGVGAGINEAHAAARLIESADLDCLMLAGRYTLIEQNTLDDVLPLAMKRGVSIIIGAPFNTGVLATGAIPGALYNNKPLEPALRRRVQRIEEVAAAYDTPLAAAAIQFPLAHPAVASVVAGISSAEEAARNVDLVTRSIPGAFWRALKDEGLLRDDAPTAAVP